MRKAWQLFPTLFYYLCPCRQVLILKVNVKVVIGTVFLGVNKINDSDLFDLNPNPLKRITNEKPKVINHRMFIDFCIA